MDEFFFWYASFIVKYNEMLKSTLLNENIAS